MIGNDIVDLQVAKLESNWRRSGYLQKIFTTIEQEFIENALDPNLEVWKLWSRKEAAYKVFNRETGLSGYFPWKLKCTLNINLSTLEKVQFNDLECFTKTYINEKFIYSVAANSIKNLSAIIELGTNENVVKINGVPFLKKNLQPISITHHGLFKRIITLSDS